MPNGKKSKGHHPKDPNTAAHSGNSASGEEPCNVDISPLVHEVNGLVDAYERAHKDDNQNSKKSLFGNRITALGTITAALGAFVYGGITYRQWRDAKENFGIDQRAWVSVTNVELAGVVVVGQPMTIKFHFINTGKTPGLNVRFTDCVAGDNERALLPFDCSANSGSVAAPNADMYAAITSPPVPQSYFDLLKTGEHRAYFKGTIRYSDIFNTSRKTGFCAMLYADRFFVCPNGNYME